MTLFEVLAQYVKWKKNWQDMKRRGGRFKHACKVIMYIILACM